MEYPIAFTEEIKALLGSESADFFAALGQDARHCLRINPLKEAAAKAAEAFSESPVEWEPFGRYIPCGVRPGASLAHAAGAFYLQDASAMAPAAVLDPKPGEVILDMCAAPGGKSGQIAGRMQGEGCLIANEYVSDRARILKSNLERLGVTNARVTNTDPDHYARYLPETFDAVLVDAPCSGEGMFRRDPDALKEWTPDSPALCAKRQMHILDCAAETVKPGGRMVYSTCTFNRMENEGSVQAFLTRHPEFVPEEFTLPGVGASENGCLRLWPHRIRGEGHFVCRMRKKGTRSDTPDTLRSPDKAAREALSRLHDAVQARLPRGNISLIGEYLSLDPSMLSIPKELNPLGPGLLLARIARAYAEPAHALAMSLSPSACPASVSLTPVQAGIYLQGEALSLDEAPGWKLVCVDGLSLGWGKVSGGTLKNHLPKGLRLRGGHEIKV